MSKKILIITSHGIRTNAPWQERLEELVLQGASALTGDRADGARSYEFAHNDYLYFSAFSFLNPYRRRHEAITFETKLRTFLESEEYDEIHLVGHSFGTHIIAHSLRRIGKDLEGRIGTVILAGSVLRKTFPWSPLVGSQIGRVVNECGDRDWILVINAILPLGSGLAGRRGFAGIMSNQFRNRYYKFGHSGYFEPQTEGGDPNAFMGERWVPLLLGQEGIPHQDERGDGFLELFEGWLVDQAANLKWLVPVACAAMVVFVALYFALVERTNFNLETLETANRISDQIDRHQTGQTSAFLAQRTTEIFSERQRGLVWFEALFRSGVRESYWPPRWERVLLADRLARSQIRRLDGVRAHKVNFRGPSTLEVVSLKSQEFDPELGNLKRQHFNLRTLERDTHPMWTWSGPWVGEYPMPRRVSRDDSGKAPRGSTDTYARYNPISDLNLQGTINKLFVVSLDESGLTLWDISADRKLEHWPPKSWSGSKLLMAEACGVAGHVLALTEHGRAYVLGPSGLVRQLKLRDATRLQHVLGDRNCARFAGVSRQQDLFVWSSSEHEGKNASHGKLGVRSIEFNAREPALLLVHDIDKRERQTTVRLLEIKGETLRNLPLPDSARVETAVFSVQGDDIAYRFEDGVCVLESIGAPARKSKKLPCPGAAIDARSLSMYIKVLEPSQNVLVAHRTGLNRDSVVTVLDGNSGQNIWTARASSSDITSMDTAGNGELIVTTHGDLANEGHANDFGVHLWSPRAIGSLFRRNREREIAQRAWISPDGAHLAVRWRGYNDKRAAEFHFVELIRLNSAIKSEVNKAPLEKIPDPTVRPNLVLSRYCAASSVGDGWLTLQTLDELRGSGTFECEDIHNDRKFFFSSKNGDEFQVRISQVGRSSNPTLTYKLNTKASPSDLDISGLGSNLYALVYEWHPSTSRLLLVRSGNAVELIEFRGKDPPLRRVVRPLDRSRARVVSISSLFGPDGQVELSLREGNKAEERHSVEIWSTDGQLVRRIEPPRNIGISRVFIGPGLLDRNGHYWNVALVFDHERKIDRLHPEEESGSDVEQVFVRLW